jgi:antitoxin VapB
MKEGNPMSQTKVAKLFKNGASQAVRLPAEFRFDGDEVYISRDEKTQDVILSKHPGARVWEEFFEFMKTVDIPEDFMKDRPMNRIPTEDRTLFSEDD